MATEPYQKVLHLFGVEEPALRRVLAEMGDPLPVTAEWTFCEGEGALTLAGQRDAVETTTTALQERLGEAVYATDGESLEQQVVALLTHHGKKVATAESCTGGLVSARLTGVPGSSRVFGTGVVSYSPDCKASMLGVSADTLAAEGTVCAAVAGQMARGVRRSAAADIGVAVTGEAGPVAAEAVPVGTVFVALADAKRTWVWELHLEGDRNGIRRQATSYVLHSLYRYLVAYPTVMAGGIANRVVQRTIPRTQGAAHPRFLARILPWRGDRPLRIVVKLVAWLSVLALLLGSGMLLYRYLLAGDSNRELQDELGNLFWDAQPEEGTSQDARYPEGMLPQFRGLYDINDGVAGWIQIADTAVDYPVMLYSDGYYKNHNFKRQYSTYGQPYFGEAARPFTETAFWTMTIYGKSTGDGQMFSDLLNYRRLAYVQEHPVLEMSTLVASARWEIFAVLVVDERSPEECDYARTEFASAEEFADYLSMLQERSLFTSSRTVTPEDRVLLLSVNSEEVYDYSGARLVVAARRMAEEESGVTYRVNRKAQMPAVLTTQARTTTRRTHKKEETKKTTTATMSTTTSTTAAGHTTGSTASTTATTAASTVDSTATTATIGSTTLPDAEGEPTDGAGWPAQSTTSSVVEEDDTVDATTTSATLPSEALPPEDREAEWGD